MSIEWEHKDLWISRHSTFAVEVSRHTAAAYEKLDLGPNRWYVYVYVYPEHGLIRSIDLFAGTQQNSLTKLPLHGGCSFFKVHQEFGGKVTSVQIGCNYSHYWDNCYSHMATTAEARPIFQDAEELFNWMLAKVKPAPRDIAPRDTKPR